MNDSLFAKKQNIMPLASESFFNTRDYDFDGRICHDLGKNTVRNAVFLERVGYMIDKSARNGKRIGYDKHAVGF